jgi:transposase-like protein
MLFFMTIIEFIQQYDTESKCRNLFKTLRDEVGVSCKRCGNQTHYWLETRSMYRCKSCKGEYSLRSGTMMEYSKRSFKDWAYTMAFMASSKKPVAALEIQKNLGCKHYKSTWIMMHKIRVSMGQRVDWYAYADFLKAGRSSVPVRAVKAKKPAFRPGSEKYKLAEKEIEANAQSYLLPAEHPFAAEAKGKLRLISFSRHEDLGERWHHPVIRKTGLGYIERPWAIKQDFDSFNVGGTEYRRNGWFDEDSNQKWLGFYEIMAVNLRRNLDGIHHYVSDRYLLNYMNEFAYLTNRRYLGTDKLRRLLTLAVTKPWHIPHFV